MRRILAPVEISAGSMDPPRFVASSSCFVFSQLFRLFSHPLDLTSPLPSCLPAARLHLFISFPVCLRALRRRNGPSDPRMGGPIDCFNCGGQELSCAEPLELCGLCSQ